MDPDKLPDAVVCYTDSTIALPILTAYALARHEPRTPKRLFDRRQELLDRLIAEYEEVMASGKGRKEGPPDTTLARDR